MDLHIRPAVQDDIPTITHIYNQAVALKSATADITPVSEDDRRHWLAEHPMDTHPVWVAENSGIVTGYASLSPYRPSRMALRYTAEISYYVHEKHRGMGIGSSLIEHAIEQCPQLGIKTLFAILLDVNADSVGLLTKFNFREVGTHARRSGFRRCRMRSSVLRTPRSGINNGGQGHLIDHESLSLDRLPN